MAATDCPQGEYFCPNECSCKIPEPTKGLLIDTMAQPETRLVRVNVNDEFTIREWSVDHNGAKVFEWSVPAEAEVTCAEITGTYDSPDMAYRQVYLKAKTADCRNFFVRTKVTATASTTATATATYDPATMTATMDGTATASMMDPNLYQQWQLVVWPAPDTHVPVMGMLIDCDADTTPRAFSVDAGASITGRTHEWATETGYAWDAPTHQWQCFELVTMNLGAFNTGYVQWQLTAKATTVECVETVPLQRSSHYTGSGPQVEDFVFTVIPSVCPAPPAGCASGLVWDSQGCNCIYPTTCPAPAAGCD
jgi:hypothetical protein